MAKTAGGAGALPEPPPPHPFKLETQKAGLWYRVHRGEYGPAQFNDTDKGDARFSPLLNPATGAVIPTIYAAATVRGAIAEILFHDAPMPSTGFIYDWERDRTSSLHLSAIHLGSLRLVNLTSLGLRAAGLSVADLFGTEKPDYPRTRRWAQHVWQTHPTAQGLRWMSVRDNTCASLMLFGDRISPAACQDAANSQPVEAYEAEVMGVLDSLGGGLGLV
jgi:hypothetical protein